MLNADGVDYHQVDAYNAKIAIIYLTFMLNVWHDTLLLTIAQCAQIQLMICVQILHIALINNVYQIAHLIFILNYIELMRALMIKELEIQDMKIIRR